MKQLTDMVYTAYVGIDWADEKHDICVQAAGSEDRVFDRIMHKPERIEAWAQAMYQRFGGPIAVALVASPRRQRAAKHLHNLGPRPVLEALVEVEAGDDLDHRLVRCGHPDIELEEVLGDDVLGATAHAGGGAESADT